jgi:hypothetical protein
MITTADMLVSVRNAIAADTALIVWCQANYAKAPAVYLGFDDDDPPDSTHYPLIQIINAVRQRGADKHRSVWDVEISIFIENTGKVSVSGGVTYTGFLHAETLKELVENALYKSKMAHIDSTGASATFSSYPEFEAVTKIRITLVADARSGISNRL